MEALVPLVMIEGSHGCVGLWHDFVCVLQLFITSHVFERDWECCIESAVFILHRVAHLIYCISGWSWSVSFSCLDLILTLLHFRGQLSFSSVHLFSDWSTSYFVVQFICFGSTIFCPMQARPIKFAQSSSPNASSPTVQVCPTSARVRVRQRRACTAPQG